MARTPAFERQGTSSGHSTSTLEEGDAYASSRPESNVIRGLQGSSESPNSPLRHPHM